MSHPKSLPEVRNVLGEPLQLCSGDPLTGYGRDGFCRRLPGDHGNHVVCAVMTDEFLKFTASRGNDLSSPRPEFEFPGLNPGDRWCLCVLRWIEARQAHCAPRVDLAATHESALEWVDLEVLKDFAAS